MNIPCSIVNDLLPLYHDSVCSEDTKRAIEEHLKTCPSCRSEYDKLLGSDGVAERAFDEENSKKIAESYKKVKKKNTWKIVLASVLAFVLTAIAALATVIGIEVYKTWPIYPQPMKQIKTVDELKADLEKAKLDLLVPDPALLHSEQNYAAVLYLTSRTRSGKATGYGMSGHSEEIGYFWQAGVESGSHISFMSDIMSSEKYKGAIIQEAEYTTDRVSIIYVFEHNGAHYWIKGDFGIFDMEEKEIEAKKLAIKEDLLNTVKGMIDSANN